MTRDAKRSALHVLKFFGEGRSDFIHACRSPSIRETTVILRQLTFQAAGKESLFHGFLVDGWKPELPDGNQNSLDGLSVRFTSLVLDTWHICPYWLPRERTAMKLQPNAVFRSDCLILLERLDAETIDLVYLDPPWGADSASDWVYSEQPTGIGAASDSSSASEKRYLSVISTRRRLSSPGTIACTVLAHGLGSGKARSKLPTPSILQQSQRASG